MSDDFFHVGDEFSGNRDVIYWTAVNGIANNGIGQTETPVGSGLLILTALGAGYAASRKHKKIFNFIVQHNKIIYTFTAPKDGIKINRL